MVSVGTYLTIFEVEPLEVAMEYGTVPNQLPTGIFYVNYGYVEFMWFEGTNV